MSMPHFAPNFVLLYVKSPRISSEFYASLLGCQPVEASDTFAMFAMGSGMMLGLWAKDTVAPTATSTGGGTELAMTVENKAMLDATHDEWRHRGLTIAQTPCEMDFGYTFVALAGCGNTQRAELRC